MDVIIEGGAPLKGVLQVPADKSILHRALMFGAMAKGTTRVTAHSPGEDNLSTAQVLRQLGVSVTREASGFVVESGGVGAFRSPQEPLDCGNSGTTMRLMTGILAGAGVEATLTGDASLCRRPMTRITGPLRSLGANVRGAPDAPQGDGVEPREVPPVMVAPGDFVGGTISSPVASAQVKSALLLAGVAAQRAVAICEPHLSRDHTERMLRAMGVDVRTEPQGGPAGVEGHGGVWVRVPPQSVLNATDFVAPGDISSAAFWLAAATLVPGSQLTIQGVGLNGSRTGILEILEEQGAAVTVQGFREVGGEPLGDLVVHSATLVAEQAGAQPTRIGGAIIPRLIDELVVLAAVASQARGVTELRDAQELRVKESDRILETQRLLQAFGVELTPHQDGWRIEGPQALRPTRVRVDSDHRIALTAAVLALLSPGESVLEGFEVAEVSYPGFVEAITALGGRARVRS